MSMNPRIRQGLNKVILEKNPEVKSEGMGWKFMV
jgi:hypothetical protein